MRYLVLSFIFIFSNTWASDANVEILSESYVSGPTIKLSEIAKYKNLSKVQMAKLEGVSLGDSPEFGEVRSFSSGAISEVLRSKLNDSSLRIEIPSNIFIKNASSKIDPLSIRTRVATEVRKGCGECKVDVRDIIIPEFDAPSLSSTWDLTPDWSRVRGAFQIPLEVTGQNGRKTIHWITGRANISAKVAIAKRNLMMGEKVQTDDLDFQERDVTYRPDPITDMKDAVGSIIRLPVTANALVTRSNIQKAPAMVRGQSVTVKMGEGTWNVTIKGIAEQNGAVGDLVKVLNPYTKKIVMGTIVADGVVEAK